VRAKGTARLALFVCVCAGCVLPARSTDAYTGKALATVSATQSGVESAILAGDLAVRGRSTAPYASVSLADAEGDASAAQSAFDSIQPPNAESDAIRSELDPILSDAVDTLSSMRITARRGDLDALAPFVREARSVSRRLSAFEQAHE
jgi:hypothetical protein